MASRFSRFKGFTRRLFGSSPPQRSTSPQIRGSVGKQFVELENRVMPATFVVTNILDNQGDITGGLSLRQAILLANANPGFDRILFNIPRSPSLPTIPGDPTENYFPIVLASTLPPLTDPAGVMIDGFTQPRNNINGTRPIIQLLPDPNPGAFPGSKGAFLVPSGNNVIRGLVITGFPGAAINLLGPESKNNYILGNWINTDISGTKPWSEDPIILGARPPATPPELTNTGPNADGTVGGNKNPLFVLAGITLTAGANNNVIGGVIDLNGEPLIDAGGQLIGTGGIITRFEDANPPGGIPITPEINRNIISGTPEFRKDYYNYTWVIDGSTKVRLREIEGAGVGPGIRIMDPGTNRNLIQGNFIGTDVTGTRPIPNHNGIEIFNSAKSNFIGNPTTLFVGDPVAAGVGNLIRFNEHDGIRSALTPNPSQINPPPPPNSPPEPYQEGFDATTGTPLGPFGPAGANAVFYDSFNPNYYVGVSPAGPNILSVARTNKAPGIFSQVGQEVILRGSGLLSTSSVTFDSKIPGETVTAKFQVIDDSEIRAIVPAGAATGKVRVFTPAGFDDTTLATIIPSPPAQIEVVSTFSPSQGTAGTVVSIFGANFTGAQSVSFGGVAATKFTVLPGGNQIDAVVPTGALTGNITVITPGGAATSTRAFNVLPQAPPAVLEISSTSGIPGQEITLKGVNFTGAYLIRFNYAGGFSGFATTNFDVDSSTQIRVRVPLFATASKNPIQVVTNDGFGVSFDPFQILTPPAPTVSGISVNSGPIGTILTISGSDFTSANRVTFAGVDASKFTVVNPNQITAVVPNGLTLGFPAVVRVFSTGGGSSTSGPTFTPTLSLAPSVNDIPFANRNTFTVVNGNNLFGTTKVLFGHPLTGIPAPSFEVLSNTQIRVQIPSAVASAGKFYVYTAYNTQNPLEPPASANFTVAPSVQPSIGTGRQTNPIAGVIGSLVTLRGQGFTGTQNVFFQSKLGGLIQADQLIVVSDFELTFRVPQLAVSGPVVVDTLGVPDTNPPFDNPTITPIQPIHITSVPFTVLPSPAPLVAGVVPGSATPGALVTINGGDLTGAVQVSFGGVPASEFKVLSDSVIQVRVPLLAASGPVTVQTPGGISTAPQPFTVLNAPFPQVVYSSPRAPRNGQISISGSGLYSTTRVQFNDIDAQFKIISDNLITATVPVTAGPGEIRVTTLGGVASSPTPFDIEFVNPPVIQAVGGRQASENADAAPVGAKVFINGTGLSSVFRVEIGGVSAKFDIVSGNKIRMIVPEMKPGTYTVSVYASTADRAKDGGNTGLGTNASVSFTTFTNILGTKFTYGEQFTVLPNARPVITGVQALDKGIPIDPVRGAPITITGSGFTGANLVRIGDIDIDDPNLFTVVDDTTITTNIPHFDDTIALDNVLVTVFTPNGIPGFAKDDLPSMQDGPEARINIQATPALSFKAAYVDDVGPFYGGKVLLTATGGNFFSTVQMVASAEDKYTGDSYGKNKATPLVAPVTAPTFFQNFTVIPGTTGKLAFAIIPPDFFRIQDGPTDPGGNQQPASALITFTAVVNAPGGGTTGVDSANTVTVFRPEDTPEIDAVVSAVNGEWNREWVILGNEHMIATQRIVFFDSNNPTGAFQLKRNQIEYIGDNQVLFKLPSIRNPLLPIQTIQTGGGKVLLFTADGKATGDYDEDQYTPQPIPQILIFQERRDPQDNRFLANRIFDNGVEIVRDPNTNLLLGVQIREQSKQLEFGNLGIDFVTQIPVDAPYRGLTAPPFYDPALPFWFGFGNTKQGPLGAPPPGNQGRGGPHDGELLSFSLPVGNSELPSSLTWNPGRNTFNNVQFGRYFGPNLLQNFPLLQVVQSTPDRTTFSTALLGKPFRIYRIDYFYNAGPENGLGDGVLDPFLTSLNPLGVVTRFDDNDKTARATSNAGFGQIFLGSKIITTDAQGNGSVSFDIARRLPLDPNDPFSIPPLQPGEFFLPGNVPLLPSVVNPITGAVEFRAGVVVTTATDLTVPLEGGPTLLTGPDGTSRFSFFRRVDTTTGSISGQVILDANNNGKADPGEPGVKDANVAIFLQRADGQYNAVPSLTLLTGEDGSYFFGTVTSGGYGLPNGNHKLQVTLPTGGTKELFFSNPPDGKRTVQIISGEAKLGINFLVRDTPPGSPPTISDIPNQTVGVGATVGPLLFTVDDAETPANLLVVTAKSSNPGVIPNGNITLGGGGTNRTITLVPLPGVTGTTTITVTVTDETGLSASDTFVVTVGAVGPNTPPFISSIANQTVQPGGTVGPISFTISDAETAPENLILTRATSNGAVIPLSSVVLGGSGSNRTVTITAGSQIGSSVITLTVTDEGGLSSQSSFVVTVPSPPGTAPSLLAVGSDAGRTAQVNVYNPNGSLRYQLTPYGVGFSGGVRVATGDVTGDGNADVIVAPGPGIPGLVKIYHGVTGEFITQFLPYGDEFKGGVYVVTGDVDGDGIQDIVTGTGKGGGPRVRVLRGGLTSGVMNLESLRDFFPYEPTFRGGVLVAAGDLNGDGFAELITGTGVGGGPRVRVLDGKTLNTIYDFFAYEPTFRGGVFASLGNVDPLAPGPEILTGTGVGGGPVVKVFRQSDLAGGGATPPPAKAFFAYDPGFRGGVRIDALDGNNDSVADIVTAPGSGLPPDVRVINYATLQDIYRLTAFEATFNGGVFVGSNV